VCDALQHGLLCAYSHLQALQLLTTVRARRCVPLSTVSTALQSKNRYDQQVATAVYASVGTVVCLAWTYFFHYLGNHPELAAESVEDWFFHAERVRTVAGGAGLLGWFLHPAVALVVFFALPVFYGLTSHGIAESPHLIKAVLVQ
jgi:hypothetical protein